MSHEEGDVRVCGLVLAAETSSVAATDRNAAESGQGYRSRSYADVEAPQTVDRLETVEAFILDLRRLSFDILGRFELSNEPTLDLKSGSNVGPTVAAQVLIHLVACKISALIGFIRSELRQLRQTIDVEDLPDRDRVMVGSPSHRPRPFRTSLGLLSRQNKKATLV